MKCTYWHRLIKWLYKCRWIKQDDQVTIRTRTDQHETDETLQIVQVAGCVQGGLTGCIHRYGSTSGRVEFDPEINRLTIESMR